MPSPEGEEENDQVADTMRVLVATDIHLGYAEKDPVRGEDSFVTFEEILQNAQQLKVDMVLLGGDLFHDNKPSRKSLFRCIELLRRYCMGDNPVKIQILSDQALNFHTSFGVVNYEDPNYNVGIPVFSIHGNHDDPAGDGGLAALDVLSACNLVNYFGKSESVDDITVYPILVAKGKTKVAIYGLGNVRDERLYRTFQQKKVKLMRPVEDRENWFSMLVLHQNRVAHSPKNYVHECMLANFLDLVLWGHEHECLITPQSSSVGDFFIVQPGSSVATSLSEGESKKKHIGLLEIYEDQFRLQAIELKTVRPFVMEEVVLKEADLDPGEPQHVIEYLAEKVEELIAKADKQSPHAPRTPTKPLIRLKVEYSGYSTVNPQRFGQRFVGRVANPNEILLFHKKRGMNPRARVDKEQDLLARATRPENLDDTRIEDLIGAFLGPTQTLEILPENELHLALHSFVEKDEKSAIAEFVAKTLSDTQKFLQKEDPEKTLQTDYIETVVNQRTANARASAEDHSMDVEAKIEQMKKRQASQAHDEEEDGEAKKEEDEENEDEEPPKAKGKGKAAAAKAKAAPAKAATKGAGRGKADSTTTTTRKAPATRRTTRSNYALQLKEPEPADDTGAANGTRKRTRDAAAAPAPDKPKPIVKQEAPVEIDDDVAPPPKQKRRITALTDLLSSKAVKGDDDTQGKAPASPVAPSSDASGKKLTTGWGKRKK